MKKINYGILSTASIVPRFVAGVNASQHGFVKGIASRSIEKAELLAKELAIPNVYGSYEAICQDPEIEIIYVATYNKAHYSAAMLALKNGKHVLLEKPFCLTVKEAKELFAYAKEHNLFIMEAQKAVFLPATLKVKELIETGIIGKIRYVNASSSHLGVERIKWFDSLESGGGTLFGSGTYPLEYLQFVLGNQFSSWTGTCLGKPNQSDSQCTLSLKLGEDTLATIFITTLVDAPSALTIYGEKGSITIPNYWKATELTVTINGEESEIFKFPMLSEFAYEVDHVNNCLEKGFIQSPWMSESVTVSTITIIETMYQEWIGNGLLTIK